MSAAGGREPRYHVAEVHVFGPESRTYFTAVDEYGQPAPFDGNAFSSREEATVAIAAMGMRIDESYEGIDYRMLCESSRNAGGYWAPSAPETQEGTL